MDVGPCTAGAGIIFGQGADGLFEFELAGLWIEVPETNAAATFVGGIALGKGGVVGVMAGIAVWIWAPDPPWWIPPFIALITAVMAYRLIRPVWRAAGLEDEI